MNFPHPQSLTAWRSVPVWLAVFMSPTAYVLLLMAWDRLQAPAPPNGVIVTLFCLIPIVALLACGTAVWRSQMRLKWRVGGLALTALAMFLQCGVWFVIIISAISVAIAPAQ